MKAELASTLTCPECGHRQAEIMPADACQWFYECTNCHKLLKRCQEIVAFFVHMATCHVRPFSLSRLQIPLSS